MDYVPLVAAFTRHKVTFGGRCRESYLSTLRDTAMPASDQRTFFARIGTASFSALMGAWWLAIKIVDWIGRLDVKDSLAAVLKQTPEWAHDLLSTSPWFPGLACLGPAAFLIVLSWPRRSLPASAPPMAVASGSPRATPATERGPLEDMMIADSHNGRAAEFRGRFSRNGTGATFYLDFSAFYPSVMGHNGWTQRRMLEVFHQERYSKGVTISFPIVARRESTGGIAWNMGSTARDTDGIAPQAYYKGRLSVLDAEEREQHVYFIILPGWKEMPTVIGQHMFDHQFEWEGKAPRAGDAESLVE